MSLTSGGGGGSTTQSQDDFVVTVPTTTTYTLSFTPIGAAIVAINGSVLSQADFVISPSTPSVTLLPSSPHLPLVIGDAITVAYQR